MSQWTKIRSGSSHGVKHGRVAKVFDTVESCAFTRTLMRAELLAAEAERKLRGAPRTLESLGGELRLSKERVRQIEAAALAKMRRALEGQGDGVYDLLA